MTNDDKPYDVGYGKPPTHSQFKKGESGNKKGKPKGAKGLKNIVIDASKKKVKIKVDGKVKSMTQLELVITQLFARAMKGDLKAAHQVLGLNQQLIAQPVEPIEDSPLTAEEQAMVDSLLAYKAQIVPEEKAQ